MSLLLFSLAAAAEPTTPPASGKRSDTEELLARDVTGWGVGVIVGLPTGLSVAFRPPKGRIWFDGGFGWAWDRGTMHIHADTLVTLSHLRSDGIPDVDFPVYLGLGIRTRLGDSPYLNDGVFEGGLRVPVGMSFIHDGLPLEGFLEVAPGIDGWPSVHALCDVAVGGRFYLP